MKLTRYLLSGFVAAACSVLWSSALLMPPENADAALAVVRKPPLIVYGASPGENATEDTAEDGIQGGRFSRILIDTLSADFDFDGKEGRSQPELLAYAQFLSMRRNAQKPDKQVMNFDARYVQDVPVCGHKTRLLAIGLDQVTVDYPTIHAAVDAHAFSRALNQACNDEVDSHMLINEDATREKILETARNLFADTEEGDVLVIFYSGFGHMIDDATRIYTHPGTASIGIPQDVAVEDLASAVREAVDVRDYTGRAEKGAVVIFIDASRLHMNLQLKKR